MSSPLILEITSNFPANLRADMDGLLSKQDYVGVWQTIEWQLMLRETGYAEKSFFVGAYEGGSLVAYALLEKRSIGLGLYGFFCLGGPIIDKSDSMDQLTLTMKELSEKEGVVFVQIEPLSCVGKSDFKAGEYKHFIEKHTAIIDLSQDNETIIARMKPKGRYNISVAERSGVVVEQVPYSEANLDAFYSILSETLERDSFAANSREYFRIFLQYLEKYELGGLFLAKRDCEVIAGGIFVFYKNTALYYYGASSSDNSKRKYMASYLLQWKAIAVAKERGCQVFDLLGIADPDDSYSPLAGVTDFKMKLTGNTRVWPDAQILVTRHVPYFLLTMRKKIKKLLAR